MFDFLYFLFEEEGVEVVLFCRTTSTTSPPKHFFVAEKIADLIDKIRTDRQPMCLTLGKIFLPLIIEDMKWQVSEVIQLFPMT